MFKRGTFKVVSTLVIILAICVVFIGTAVYAQDETKEEEVTLKVLIVQEKFEEIFDPHFFQVYEKKNNVNIEYETFPFPQYYEIVEVKHQAEEEIDVIFVNAPEVPSYSTRGVIQSVDEYFTEEELDQWTDVTVERGTWDGKLMAPPFRDSFQILYYNKSLLKQAGVEPPSVDIDERWTWSQLVEAAKKVDALGDDIWGFSFEQANIYYQVMPLPLSLGGGTGIDEEGNVDITNEAWVEGFTWYGKLYNDWKISPAGRSIPEIRSLFRAGKIGFYIAGPWEMINGPAAGVDMGVAPHPYFEKGKPANTGGGWHLGVSAYSQHPEEAAKLIKEITLDLPFSLYRHWLTSAFTPHKGVIEYINNSPKYDEQPSVGHRLGAHAVENTAHTRARSAGFPEFREILNDAIEDIRNGAEVKETLQTAEMRIEQRLKRYQ